MVLLVLDKGSESDGASGQKSPWDIVPTLKKRLDRRRNKGGESRIESLQLCSKSARCVIGDLTSLCQLLFRFVYVPFVVYTVYLFIAWHSVLFVAVSMCRLATNGGGDAAATSALAEANSRLQLGTSKTVFHIYLLGAHMAALNKKWEWEGLKSPFVNHRACLGKHVTWRGQSREFRLRTSYSIFPCHAKRERTSPLWVNMVMLSGHKMNMHKFYNDQLQFQHATSTFWCLS